jgi:hypothetical protein
MDPESTLNAVIDGRINRTAASKHRNAPDVNYTKLYLNQPLSEVITITEPKNGNAPAAKAQLDAVKGEKGAKGKGQSKGKSKGKGKSKEVAPKPKAKVGPKGQESSKGKSKGKGKGTEKGKGKGLKGGGKGK